MMNVTDTTKKECVHHWLCESNGQAVCKKCGARVRFKTTITIEVPIYKYGIGQEITEATGLINDTGDFLIVIKASGVNWQLKIGVEP